MQEITHEIDECRTDADAQFVFSADLIDEVENGVNHAISLSSHRTELEQSNELNLLRATLKLLNQQINAFHRRIIGT